MYLFKSKDGEVIIGAYLSLTFLETKAQNKTCNRDPHLQSSSCPRQQKTRPDKYKNSKVMF